MKVAIGEIKTAPGWGCCVKTYVTISSEGSVEAWARDVSRSFPSLRGQGTHLEEGCTHRWGSVVCGHVWRKVRLVSPELPSESCGEGARRC